MQRVLTQNDETSGYFRHIRVEVLAGPDRGIVYEPTDKLFAIGTSPDNKIVLTDPSIGRYHLELQADNGVRIKDFGNRNGTFVNDIRICEAIVPFGVHVRIGETVLRLDEGIGEALSSPNRPLVVPGLVVNSEAMQTVARAVNRLSEADSPVLMQGETGTGKEFIARLIHDSSPRANAPFAVAEVDALDPNVIESYLFGHARTSVDGPDSRRKGAFEQAQGGSIYLEEIGALPMSVQPTLLRVLEEQSLRIADGQPDVQIDVRVFASSQCDLRALVNLEAFRADLYLRLAGDRILVPPLRERREDMDGLMTQFAREISGASEHPFSRDIMQTICDRCWSGNTQQLRRLVENALLLRNKTTEGLAPENREALPSAGFLPYRHARSEAIATFELRYLSQLMDVSGGNASGAARTACMDRPYLLSLLRKHGLR
jgi:DNA-binding NtrC family response regulator